MKKALSIRLDQAHEQTEELEAYYALEDTDGTTTETTLGKLNIISYNNQLVNVYLVPVDGANL